MSGKNKQYGEVVQRAKRVKCVIFDVDGVFTDGLIYCDDAGRESCAFHIRDGLGVKQLLAAGLGVAVISGRRSKATAARMAYLGVEDVHLGIENKAEVLTNIVNAREISFDETAYMGDDLVDLQAMTQCGLACAPSDAHESVKRAAHWVASAAGGRGAVRELCEWLLREQGLWKD